MNGLTTFAAFDKVEMDRHALGKCMREAITMMIEYRDQHGQAEEQAIEAAVQECLIGMDAANELQEMGECTAPQFKFSTDSLPAPTDRQDDYDPLDDEDDPRAYGLNNGF